MTGLKCPKCGRCYIYYALVCIWCGPRLPTQVTNDTCPNCGLSPYQPSTTGCPLDFHCHVSIV
jgi:predicted RNA-binding Zn-ribbon protein involved in translation (DUF1610 family)